MRPRSSALRLNETAADGATTSGTPSASLTRTFLSSNWSSPLSLRRKATLSMLTRRPANSSAMPDSMG